MEVTADRRETAWEAVDAMQPIARAPLEESGTVGRMRDAYAHVTHGEMDYEAHTVQVEALARLRRILGGDSPPLQEVLQHPRAVKTLQWYLEMPHVSEAHKKEAAWCVTNLAAGNAESTAAVLPTAPALLRILSQPLHNSGMELKDQCAWALGNMAACCPSCRNALLSLTAPPSHVPLAVAALVALFCPPEGLANKLPPVASAIYCNAAWALANLARSPSGGLVACFFTAGFARGLARFLAILELPSSAAALGQAIEQSRQFEKPSVNIRLLEQLAVTQELCWLAALLCHVSLADVAQVLQTPQEMLLDPCRPDLGLSPEGSQVLSGTVAVLCHACVHGLSQGLPAIRLLNNFVLHSPVVALILAREEVFLFALLQVLQQTICHPVQKEAALLLTNLTAGGEECRAVIASNGPLLEAACSILENGSEHTKKEVSFAVVNLVTVASVHQQGLAVRVASPMQTLLQSCDREGQQAAIRFFLFLAHSKLHPQGLASALPLLERIAGGGEAAAAAVLEQARVSA